MPGRIPIANYGIRTMVADENLWLGTANPMNLLTDAEPLDGLEAKGGWEIIQLGDNALRLERQIPALGGFGLFLPGGLLLGPGSRRLRKP